MIERINLNVPLSIPEVLMWIGHIASKLPYNNGEGLAAEVLCKEIAGKIKNQKVEVPIKAVDILVKIIDQERLKGNNSTVVDIDKLIKLLKGGLNRKILGAFLHAITLDKFKETDDGKLKSEFVIEKPVKLKEL